MVEYVTAAQPNAKMAPSNERQKIPNPEAFKSTDRATNTQNNQGCGTRIQVPPARQVVPTPLSVPEPAVGPPPSFPVNVLEADEMHRRKRGQLCACHRWGRHCDQYRREKAAAVQAMGRT